MIRQRFHSMLAFLGILSFISAPSNPEPVVRSFPFPLHDKKVVVKSRGRLRYPSCKMTGKLYRRVKSRGLLPKV